MAEPAFIYVIRRGPRAHKVGLSTAPKRRLLGLQGGSRERLSIANCSPTPLENAKEIEAFAHWILRESHRNGEWFDVTAETAWAAVNVAIEAIRNGERAPRRITGVGRPPIKRDAKVKQTTVWLHQDMVARIVALVGPQGMSAFMREAAENELKRRERASRSASSSSPSHGGQ